MNPFYNNLDKLFEIVVTDKLICKVQIISNNESNLHFITCFKNNRMDEVKI
jgi:hypothetical protein